MDFRNTLVSDLCYAVTVYDKKTITYTQFLRNILLDQEGRQRGVRFDLLRESSLRNKMVGF